MIFEVIPYKGLVKVHFGMLRRQVHELLGHPTWAQGPDSTGLILESFFVDSYAVLVGYLGEVCEYIAIFGGAEEQNPPEVSLNSDGVLITGILDKSFGEMRNLAAQLDPTSYFVADARSIVVPKYGFLFVSDGTESQPNLKGLVIELSSKAYWSRYVPVAGL
ncbi:MAG: hypothetical protein SFU83_14545 [Meiothermus sp.]|nr:hypothetical protein [Meiothermus sp.]